MTDLWILCEHGEKEPHTVWLDTALADPRVCPGGHQATMQEVFAWLERQPEAEQVKQAAWALFRADETREWNERHNV